MYTINSRLISTNLLIAWEIVVNFYLRNKEKSAKIALEMLEITKLSFKQWRTIPNKNCKLQWTCLGLHDDANDNDHCISIFDDLHYCYLIDLDFNSILCIKCIIGILYDERMFKFSPGKY